MTVIIESVAFALLLAADVPGEEKLPKNIPADQKETAQEQAKKAELTPVVPSPTDVTKPAYQLYLETDFPILGIGVAMALARFINNQPAYCVPLCNPAELNPLDRLTAGFYDRRWSLASDLGLYGLAAAATLYLIVDEGILPALNDAVVIIESALGAMAVASIATFAVARPRPLLYGERAPLEVRSGADAGLSFLSSHSSTAFAIAVSTYMTMIRLHPKAKAVLPIVGLVVGLATAGFVATARVMGGNHFVTDVVGGAIVGSSIGIVIPAVHGAPVKVVPKVTGQAATLDLLATF